MVLAERVRSCNRDVRIFVCYDCSREIRVSADSGTDRKINRISGNW